MKLENGKFIVYHRTDPEGARSILANGFKNSSGYFLSNRTWTGVRLSSIPDDGDPAGEDQSLLMVKLDLGKRELSRWEWLSEGKRHREWLLPAGIVNKCATVEILGQLDTSTVAA